MKIDGHYTNHRLVALYDLQNAWASDTNYYLSLSKSGQDVLDLGCGTGILAHAIAKKSATVTGVDPAQPMLDFAAKKPGGSQITWIQSSAQEYKSPQQFDLITMTGHAFQALISDNDIELTLGQIRENLRIGGIASFETRNPTARAWQSWTRRNTEVTFHIDGSEVVCWVDQPVQSGDLVTFDNYYQFGDEILVSRSLIRFIDLSTLFRMIEKAGLEIAAVYGRWERSVFRNEDKEAIFLPQRRR